MTNTNRYSGMNTQQLFEQIQDLKQQLITLNLKGVEEVALVKKLALELYELSLLLEFAISNAQLAGQLEAQETAEESAAVIAEEERPKETQDFDQETASATLTESMETDTTASAPESLSEPAQNPPSEEQIHDEVEMEETLSEIHQDFPKWLHQLKQISIHNTTADKFQKRPIANLKTAIGINDRFAFINDLFDGNAEAYHRAIDELNHLEDFESAQLLIAHDYLSKYKWNVEDHLVVQFLTLVERRYLPIS